MSMCISVINIKNDCIPAEDRPISQYDHLHNNNIYLKSNIQCI